MATNSKIQWTDATWNPVAGCSQVSEGCKNCYAMRMARRLSSMGQPKYFGTAKTGPSGHVNWTGQINLDEASLEIPLRWRKPRRIFVNSMSDLFHEKVSSEFIGKVFSVMARAPRHTFQILTKRPERMLNWFMEVALVGAPAGLLKASGGRWPLPNVWLGVTVENQKAIPRIELLRKVPAAIRFLSCEPLLELVEIPIPFRCSKCFHEWTWTAPVTRATPSCPKCDAMHSCRVEGLDWVIAGGESGPGARAMHPQWVRSIRDQCRAAGVPFHFKQWGEWAPVGKHGSLIPHRGWLPLRGHGQGISEREEYMHENGAEYVERLGSARSGRTLDGAEWNEFPEVKT